MPEDLVSIGSPQIISERISDVFQGLATWGDIGLLSLFLTFTLLYLYLFYAIIFRPEFRRRLFAPYVLFISRFFGIQTEINSRFDDDFVSRIEEVVKRHSLNEMNFSNIAEEKIISLLEKSLDANLGVSIQESLGQFIKKEFREFQTKESIQRLMSARGRLQNAMSSVSARGVVSLVIGIIVAAGAFFVLRSMIDVITLMKPDNNGKVMDGTIITTIAISRLSTVIFVTFISYFFLSLYKRSLDEVKYYQAELTNIDAWISAVSSQGADSDPRISSYIVARLLETDRSATLSLESKNVVRGDGTPIMSTDILKSLIEKIPLK
jgi:hypothetical protein